MCGEEMHCNLLQGEKKRNKKAAATRGNYMVQRDNNSSSRSFVVIWITESSRDGYVQNIWLDISIHGRKKMKATPTTQSIMLGKEQWPNLQGCQSTSNKDTRVEIFAQNLQHTLNPPHLKHQTVHAREPLPLLYLLSSAFQS